MMKKALRTTLAVLMCAALLLALVACGGGAPARQRQSKSLWQIATGFFYRSSPRIKSAKASRVLIS